MNGESNVYSTDDYERGYRQGFQDGIDFARKNINTIPTVPSYVPTFLGNHCRVCGVDFSKMTHYVCNLSNCPTRITCGAAGAYTVSDTPAGMNGSSK